MSRWELADLKKPDSQLSQFLNGVLQLGMGSVTHGLRLITNGLRCVHNGRFESIKDFWVHISTKERKCRMSGGGRPSIYSFGCSSGAFIQCCLWGCRWCRLGSRLGTRLMSRLRSRLRSCLRSRLLDCFRRGQRCHYYCCMNGICGRRRQGLFWDSGRALFRLGTRRHSRDYIVEWLEPAFPSYNCHIELAHTTTSNWGQSHGASKEYFELHLWL